MVSVGALGGKCLVRQKLGAALREAGPVVLVPAARGLGTPRMLDGERERNEDDDTNDSTTSHSSITHVTTFLVGARVFGTHPRTAHRMHRVRRRKPRTHLHSR